LVGQSKRSEASSEEEDENCVDPDAIITEDGEELEIADLTERDLEALGF
jgi:hypothetical protein